MMTPPDQHTATKEELSLASGEVEAPADGQSVELSDRELDRVAAGTGIAPSVDSGDRSLRKSPAWGHGNDW